MANRTMQAKDRKLRRQKRAWAKPYSLRSTVLGPNRGVLQEYKERAIGLGADEFSIDTAIQTMYNRPVFTENKHYGERAKVLATLENMKAQVPSLQFFPLIDNCYQNAKLWYNTNKTVWIITHIDKRRKIFKRSIWYDSKDTALIWYRRSKVVWADERVLE